jgi:hypothetical protein
MVMWPKLGQVHPKETPPLDYHDGMHVELLCNSKVLRVNPWSGGIFPSHGNIPHLGLPPMVSGDNLIIINHMWLIKLGLAGELFVNLLFNSLYFIQSTLSIMGSFIYKNWCL